MDLQELGALVRRGAARSFDPAGELPHGVVEDLVEMARWTGSARNRQPWQFVEVRDRATVRALAELGAYAQFVAAAPVVLVVASAGNGFADTDFDTGRITQSIVLGAAALGLGCCPATLFPEENVDAAGALLGLSTDWRARHLLALGYPARRGPGAGTSAVPVGRRPVTDLLTTIAEPSSP